MSEKDTSQILIGYDTLPTDKHCCVATFQEKALSIATQKKNACQEENLKLCAKCPQASTCLTRLLVRHVRINDGRLIVSLCTHPHTCTYMYMCVQCTYIDDHNAAKVSRKTAPFGGLGINSGLQPHILKLICDLLDRRDEKLLMPDARTVVGSGRDRVFASAVSRTMILIVVAR